MDCFDIHTHSMTGDLSQVILSIDASAFPVEEKVVYASIGIHPWNLTETNAESQWKALQDAVKDPRIRAIGEAGLDKLRGAPLALQTSVFRQEIALAERCRLPMVIHCVRAWNELIQLKKEIQPCQPWIVHGFRGKPSVAQELLRQGCRLSFGSCFQEESVRLTPLSRLFIETDESEESIGSIYRRVADVCGISLQELTEAVKKNVQEVFFKP